MAFKTGNIGAAVSVQGQKVANQASAGATNGGWVAVADLISGQGMLGSCKAFGVLSNVTGAPSAATLKLKMQDATDNSGTGSADYKPDGTNVAQSTTGVSEGSPATTTNDICELNANLGNARAFVRVVGTTTFTAGTAPKADVVVGLVVGGGSATPATTQNP